MSSPSEVEEDDMGEVEFVSEGPLRPVTECVDLLSDSGEEGCSTSTGTTIDDEIDRQKAHVASTLDRLVQQVALEKRQRADKCRAFKEKQIQQRIHGQQELMIRSTNPKTQEAKRCVDAWLKMPGLQFGVNNSGSGRRRRRQSAFPLNPSVKHTCPVINCGRVFENVFLLDGHLKRFDHSPCDPTISLKGSPTMLFSCVVCCRHFQTKEEWRTHVQSKASSSNSGGHCTSQNYQLIVCFACPACYLLFNLRDECLQHMSAKNHFTESLTMSSTDSKQGAVPVPMPQHAKNRLIALCKDAPFTVKCTLCQKVLSSHQTAQAHFNVHCRQGCAVAMADTTVAQVAKQLQVRGQCSLCCLIFLSEEEVERHRENTQHHVEVNRTMERALLQFCRFSENQHRADNEEKRPVSSKQFQKRNKNGGERDECPTKRQKLRSSITMWFCECGQRFSEAGSASKHILAVNQINFQCGVCGKLMGESSITRLHMSRFHGGAHLSNFCFYCRKCKLEMPRLEDIMSHVSDVHQGHTFFTEKEVPAEAEAKPSIKDPCSSSTLTPVPAEVASVSKAAPTWMCRMCEDVFDSEAAVHKHCSDVSSHSFQRFACGHCPQKFFKESTVRRHCANEHNGQMKSAHFCGLCDSMLFESEGEFRQHYESLHSRDYYCMDDGDRVQPASAAESVSPADSCPCMGSEKTKDAMKATYTRCMVKLASQGHCQYMCAPCAVTAPSYAQIKTHVQTTHAALNLDKTFEVECRTCGEHFADVPSFHKHHHSQHCTLEPCMSSRTSGDKVEGKPQVLNAVEVKEELHEMKDEMLQRFLKMEQTERDVCQSVEQNQHGSDSTDDDEVKQALALSVEEDQQESAEFAEALKRSLLEY
uniref:E3 SUMO-protein ligase ZNF451 n=1 Tax=Doryrhamphus excisus TaxID=161450 RepID=UPI0025AE962C|nr:E3 SUMO-protein ligase ZNF451 [Doryrhamphus excisus]XP_057915016.1 E3 SUMO-protein ligase ZNF451 [Doryrhamphus excisus]XP_057915017.1 E3 SUMO-protein ligase ZNF451 [Doryrhamphus excisus]XP_057915018.1 E3 SUMO-protein ligase ZNF451 [Doryrhamphus excisus]